MKNDACIFNFQAAGPSEQICNDVLPQQRYKNEIKTSRDVKSQVELRPLYSANNQSITNALQTHVYLYAVTHIQTCKYI